jgi:hypothetical protein
MMKNGQIMTIKRGVAGVAALIALIVCSTAQATARDQARRIHDRLAGIPPSDTVLDSMTTLVQDGDLREAAEVAMQNDAFYDVTLKNFVTPWTNEEQDVFAPLNDYTATVIGMVRDGVDFRQVLYGDLIYVGDQTALQNDGYNIAPVSISNNEHYRDLEDSGASLQDYLVASTQSAVYGLPSNATAGVMTSRAAAGSFFYAGTNRAMFRFTLMNHMCRDLEQVKDTSLPADRIRQDVSRSPGGDSRIFLNSCVGCHSGMDPLAQAFAYYDWQGEQNGEPGQIIYNGPGTQDPDTGTRVQGKNLINANNFPYGYVTEDDSWDNYWREGINSNLGWDSSLPGSGEGAKSMGMELAHSDAFASCQARKVFRAVCLRAPDSSADVSQVESMTSNFRSSGYRMDELFIDAAVYCRGQ